MQAQKILYGIWHGYDRHLGHVTQLGGEAYRLLNPSPGEKILDVGCGTGGHVREMQHIGVKAFGIDACAEQVEECRRHGIEGVAHMRVEDIAASFDHAHEFLQAGSFDAVFSNAALHYATCIERDFKSLHRLLRRGGRIVAEMGGSIGQVHCGKAPIHETNLAILQKAISQAAEEFARQGRLPELSYQGGRGIRRFSQQNYVYQPTAERICAVLRDAGFDNIRTEVFARPTPVANLAFAVRGYCSNLLPHFPSSEMNPFLYRVTQIASRTYPKNGDGHYIMDYLRLRFSAVKHAR